MRRVLSADRSADLEAPAWVRAPRRDLVGLLVKTSPRQGWGLVCAGSLRWRLPLRELVPVDMAPSREDGSGLRGPHPRPVLPPSLDIHGLRADAARRVVEKYLDTAAVCGLAQVKIIHGYGEGILMRVVREVLDASWVIEDYRFGTPQEGATAVTIARLRRTS